MVQPRSGMGQVDQSPYLVTLHLLGPISDFLVYLIGDALVAHVESVECDQKDGESSGGERGKIGQDKGVSERL
jgi:hypothetical protein